MGLGQRGTRQIIGSCLQRGVCDAADALDFPAIFLVGDSHVDNNLNALRIAVHGRATVSSFGSLCGYAPLSTAWAGGGAFGGNAARCPDELSWQQEALRGVLRPGDVVAITVAAYKFCLGQDRVIRTEDCDISKVTDYVALMNETRRLVVSAGARLLILGDLPTLDTVSLTDHPTPPTGCRELAVAPNRGTSVTAKWYCEVRYSDAWVRYAPLADGLRRFTEAYATEGSVYFYDPFSLFCNSTGPDGVCSGKVPGTAGELMLMRDNDHTELAPGALYTNGRTCVPFSPVRAFLKTGRRSLARRFGWRRYG